MHNVSWHLMPDPILISGTIFFALTSAILSVVVIRLYRRVNLLRQELALTRYSASLPRSEKRAVAMSICHRWARKPLFTRGDNTRLIPQYCLEAAKEISLVYNRRDLLDFTVKDLKRALDLLYSHCARAHIAQISVSKALAVLEAVKGTEDVRFFYNAGMTILAAATMNWGSFGYRVAMFVFPRARLKNSATIYFAGYLALSLYEGEAAADPDPALATTLESHSFSGRDVCRRCGTTRAAAVALRSSCYPAPTLPTARALQALQSAGDTLRRIPRTLRARLPWSRAPKPPSHRQGKAS